jgi:DNA-binding MarR family transcriptional regulator
VVEPAETNPDRARLAEAVRALARGSRVLERVSGELSMAHYRVLAAVSGGAERASLVAQRLALGKPTVSAAVDALHRRGLLTRTAAEGGDQRVAVLRLTEAGAALLATVETEMIARITGLLDRTPDGDRVVESLVWLGAAIDEAAAERAAARRTAR